MLDLELGSLDFGLLNLTGYCDRGLSVCVQRPRDASRKCAKSGLFTLQEFPKEGIKEDEISLKTYMAF